MILVLTPNIKLDSDAYEQLVAHLSHLQNIQWRVHHEQGAERTLTEIYLSILDIMHATAQGVIAGANLVLVDFHPEPAGALVDGPQALLLSELPQFLEDVQIAHKAYLDREALAERSRNILETR